MEEDFNLDEFEDIDNDGENIVQRKEKSEEYFLRMKLKAAFHYNVGKICEKQGKEGNHVFSKKFIAALTETTWKQMGMFGQDLEAFARHARRSTVLPDDVKLLARRSPSVSRHLSSMAEELSSKASKKRPKKPRLDKDEEPVPVLIS